jgi:hypothetical protein
MSALRRREILAILPWLLAAMVWFGVLTPMRAMEENRLAEQTRTRRERLKADRASRGIEALQARLAAALKGACRGSSDPSILRERAVRATKGLALAPFSLSVTGGVDGGAVVEAGGSRGAVIEFLDRIGDPSRGGFLRSASIRDRAGRWSISAATGILESFQGASVPRPPACPDAPYAPPADPGPRAENARGPERPAPPAPPRELPTPPLTFAPEASGPAPPPFTLVAFLMSRGRTRASLRIGDEIRVVSAGDVTLGWRCVSIDRDEGAVFDSPSGGRVVLRSSASSER